MNRTCLVTVKETCFKPTFINNNTGGNYLEKRIIYNSDHCGYGFHQRGRGR